MFAPSDSDSDVPSFHSIKQSAPSTTGTHAPKPDGRTLTDHPDSLDAYMRTLQSSVVNSTVVRYSKVTSKSSTSSEDEPVPITCPPSHNSDRTPSSLQMEDRQLSLPPIDYSSQSLPPVNRLAFNPRCLSPENSITVVENVGSSPVSVRNGSAPILRVFDDLSPPSSRKLVDALSIAYPAPTPIQAVSIPHSLSGRDIIAIAQTGSGKTIAYSVPLLTHVAAQKGTSRSGNGPVGLVLSPTRELALQISQVLDEFGKCISVKTCYIVGGVPKFEQYKLVRDSGAAIFVCTPGRLIDMLRMRACRMNRCSFIVIDEVDRMLDMGFGAQVRTVLSQIRPDAQRALYSATLPKFVERLVSEFLNNPVHISITGGSNRQTAMVTNNVKDCFYHFNNDSARQTWLVNHLASLVSEGLLIIFCSTRGESAALANILRATGIPTACIHGETEQADREELLRMFRENELPILVSTDLAARGLDIVGVQNVVNYGCAKSWEWHVHRCGRTGRASRKGNAYTLMDSTCRSDLAFARHAVDVLRREDRDVPKALEYLNELSRRTGSDVYKHVRAKRSKR